MSPVLGIVLTVALTTVMAVIVVFPGSAVVTAVLAKAGATVSEDVDDQQLRGGRWIGRLERLAVFASLMMGFPEGVAIVLAVKSLARYPELRATNSEIAEKFIIGTFTSVLYAAGLAGLTLWLIHLW